MKQTLLRLLGLSPESKAQKLEKRRQKNIKDRNALLAKFDKESLEHRKKCEELVKAGYTSKALPTQPCTLVFGTHFSPIFSAEAAAALFAKFLEEENICADDITLEKKESALCFEEAPELCWMYNDFYIALDTEPEYGYMNSEICKSCYSWPNEIFHLQIDSNRSRFLNLDFEKKLNQLKAKELYYKYYGSNYKTILRTYPDGVSEAELVNDCREFEDYLSIN